MSARTSGVCLRYALRSVALTLFPTAFIALFTWATAGSTSGNTTDPMRATGWLWLAAHQVPLVINGATSQGSGVLSFLPLLALLFPWWAIRRSYLSVRAELPTGFLPQLYFSLWYAGIAEFISFASFSHHIHANIYIAPAFSFLIALAATTKFSPSALNYFKFVAFLAVALVGAATLIFTASLCAHWSIMKSIEIVIAPSAVGGLLYTLVQLLYLPNIAIATLGYLSGSGFTFGAHTNISPSRFVLNGISAIPALSALPTGKHSLFSYGVVVWPLLFILCILLICRNIREFGQRATEALATSLIFIAAVTGVSFLASGELLTSALNRVGVQWLRTTEVVAVSACCALILGILLPQGIQSITTRLAGRNE